MTNTAKIPSILWKKAEQCPSQAKNASMHRTMAMTITLNRPSYQIKELFLTERLSLKTMIYAHIGDMTTTESSKVLARVFIYFNIWFTYFSNAVADLLMNCSIYFTATYSTFVFMTKLKFVPSDFSHFFGKIL